MCSTLLFVLRLVLGLLTISLFDDLHRIDSGLTKTFLSEKVLFAKRASKRVAKELGREYGVELVEVHFGGILQFQLATVHLSSALLQLVS